MGLDSDPPSDDPTFPYSPDASMSLKPPRLPSDMLPPDLYASDLAVAHLAADDAPAKESVSEDAEERAFLRRLFRERNDLIARESAIGMAVAVALTATVWVGYGAADPSERSAVADAASVAPAVETAVRAPIGPPMPPTIEGNLGRAAVNEAVAKQAPQLRRCFEMGFERDPNMTGGVTMKLLVSETGDVIGVADLGQATGSGVGDRAVVHCVARSMRALSFPPPTTGRALVTYPIQPPR